MREIEEALAGLGLVWEDVWALTADRRAGTLVVVALDGRKAAAALPASGLRSADGRPRRVKAIKAAGDDEGRANTL